MKKIILLVAALCCAGVASAEGELISRSIFYGEYASGNSQTPCAGPTSRMCAETDITGPLNPGGGGLQKSVGVSTKFVKVIKLPADTPWQDYVKMKKLEDPAKGIYVVLEKDGDNEN